MRNVVIVVISVLLIVAVGSTGWLYYQKKELSQEYKKAQKEWFQKEQKLSKNLNTAKENVKKIKNELNGVKEELKDTHYELDNVKKEKEELKNKFEIQEAEFRKIKDRLEKKQEKISKLKEENEKYKQHFKELKDDYKNLYSKTVEDYDIPSSKFSEKLEQWAKEKDNLKEELQVLSEKLKSSGVEREELIGQINTINSLLKRRIVKIASFKKKLDELKAKSKELAMEKAFDAVSSVQLPSIVVNKGTKNKGLIFTDTAKDESFLSEFSKKNTTSNGKKNKGKILAVNQAENFVILNLGSKDGIEKGMMFEVSRNNEKIGKVKVIEVREKLCAANIEKVIYGKIITANDKVKLYE